MDSIRKYYNAVQKKKKKKQEKENIRKMRKKSGYTKLTKILHCACTVRIWFVNLMCLCMYMYWTEIIPRVCVCVCRFFVAFSLSLCVCVSFNSHGIFHTNIIIYKIGDVWFCCAIFIAFQRKLGYSHPFSFLFFYTIFRYMLCMLFSLALFGYNLFLFSHPNIGWKTIEIHWLWERFIFGCRYIIMRVYVCLCLSNFGSR